MKSYLMTSLFIFSYPLFATCINTTMDEYIQSIHIKEYQSQKSLRHNLIYSNDSCGARGCELFIFTEILPGCTTLTFNRMGYPLPNSLRGNILKIRKSGKINSYKFSSIHQKFIRTAHE